ncbi:uncharacterized protein LOC131207705 [Anopheles bellator]|uniref:uncharacterized protein LOC131207705 n=1 Tax=Anopheles bellator TaxID=139047 RepID=UPI002649ED36|nr:uncharacterized protein LOC131207705 [Anopheles bellator]
MDSPTLVRVERARLRQEADGSGRTSSQQQQHREDSLERCLLDPKPKPTGQIKTPSDETIEPIMAKVPITAPPPQGELDWIQVHQQLADFHAETPKEKMARKVKENPLVPVGCAATLTALGFGLWNFRKGRSAMSQYMMRARILAQGFTVVALIVGAGMTYANKRVSKK